MWTTAAQTAAVGAVLGVGAGWVIIPQPDPMLVDLVSVEYAAPASLVYTRDVLSDHVVLAEYARRILTADTDETVEECVTRGEADYGPLEARVQTFKLNDACADALVVGEKYKVFALVAPFSGPADTYVSKPFVWGE